MLKEAYAIARHERVIAALVIGGDVIDGQWAIREKVQEAENLRAKRLRKAISSVPTRQGEPE